MVIEVLCAAWMETVLVAYALPLGRSGWDGKITWNGMVDQSPLAFRAFVTWSAKGCSHGFHEYFIKSKHSKRIGMIQYSDVEWDMEDAMGYRWSSAKECH